MIVDIKAYYDSGGMKEWDRLSNSSYDRIEFEITTGVLEKYLPKKGKVLDFGGGPGRYSFWLADRGFETHLIDLSDKLVKIAEKKNLSAKNKIKRIGRGDHLSLANFRNNEFDSVLCLGGVLSHITDENERRNTVKELIRIAKPNSKMFISVVGLFGGIRRLILRHQPPEKLRELIETKLNPAGTGFTSCLFFTPTDFKELLESEGLLNIKLFGCEGIASVYEEYTNKLDPKQEVIWREFLFETSGRKELLHYTDHLLAVVETPSK